VFAAAAFVLAVALGHAGIANADPQIFNVDGYTNCAANAGAAVDPNGSTDVDATVVSCCVQNAGTPADTPYGMGCMGPQGAADRPTIVLPTRALPVPDQDPTDLLDPQSSALLDPQSSALVDPHSTDLVDPP
jgi:hypothetical protein